MEEKHQVKLPRVAITYCTQCKWMLRAAYFGQELLSTFNLAIGEVALVPTTGGIFTVSLTYRSSEGDGEAAQTREVLIWDRKTDGGFPEAKILKQRIRNHIEPDRNLGHSDTPSSKPANNEEPSKGKDSDATTTGMGAAKCEDCN